MREILLCALIAASGLPTLYGQDSVQGFINPVSTAPGGIRLQSVSGFMTYYTGGQSSGYLNSSGAFTGAGGSATIGYTNFREQSGVSITYTPTYSTSPGQFSSSEQNHALSLNWRRKLSPRWSYSVALSGVVAYQSQAIFGSTTLSRVAGTPATFDELAAGMVSGKSPNDQLTSVLTGAPLLESPAGLILYGSRSFSSSAQTGINYAYSSRLSFHVNVGAARSQALKDDASGVLQQNPLLAHTTSGTGSIGVSYSISPRTQLSTDWSSTRTVSSIEDVFVHSANVSVGHTMSERWFVQAQGGGGGLVVARNLYRAPNGKQFQLGGGLGYRSREHTFLASASRSISDAYGFGANSSVGVTGAWSWKRPGASWSTTASVGEQWLLGAAVNNIRNWRASFGLERRFGPHLSMVTEYAYLSNAGVLYGIPLPSGQQSVRVSLAWHPASMAPQ